LDHQRYPYSLLAGYLAPGGTLFDTLFSFNRATNPGMEELAAMSLGVPGAHIALGGLQWESLAVEQRWIEHDLSLDLAEFRGGVSGRLRYNRDLSDAVTAERMASQYAGLVERLVAEPATRIGEGALLSAAERQQVLVEWNEAGDVAGERGRTLHGLIEE